MALGERSGGIKRVFTEGVEIVNILGQTVLSFQKLNENKINVLGLESWVYFLRIYYTRF